MVTSIKSIYARVAKLPEQHDSHIAQGAHAKASSTYARHEMEDPTETEVEIGWWNQSLQCWYAACAGQDARSWPRRNIDYPDSQSELVRTTRVR
jgi:hypothetical protein